MSAIRSKVHNYGDANESSWPSRFGTGTKTPKYICRETGELKEGYPPPEVKNGVAPIVIFDSMPPEYHEKACRVINSRKEWEAADKEHGSLTFSSVEEPRRNVAKGIKEEEKELKADRRKASIAATQAYKENKKEIKQKIEKQAEKQHETLRKAGVVQELNNSIKEKI